jgi:hypothetical protein
LMIFFLIILYTILIILDASSGDLETAWREMKKSYMVA